jgi:prepilin-type N-terminal cleavage/methylation domain-containing protein
MSVHPRPSSRSCRRRAFTLVELIAVTAIIGVLAAVGVGSLGGIVSTRQAAAARSLARDLNLAREHAMTRGRSAWVSFDTAGARYSLLLDDAITPGRPAAGLMPDPATGADFTIALDAGASAGVRILSVSIPGGGSDLGFDWMGRPQDAAGTLLSGNCQVTLTGGKTVTVVARTGLTTSH